MEWRNPNEIRWYKMIGVWIARWVCDQRQRYLGCQTSPLTGEQIHKLDTFTDDKDKANDLCRFLHSGCRKSVILNEVKDL